MASQSQTAESEEFCKAGIRIRDSRHIYTGEQPRGKALAWAVQFAVEDARAYSLGELANRWAEVKRFASDAGLGPDVPPRFDRVTVRSPRFVIADRVYVGSVERHCLSNLQAEARAYLELYVTQGVMRTNGVTLDFVVHRTAPRVSVIAELHPSFLYQLFHLTAEMGWQLHKCCGCPKLFVASRRDKKWCSNLCQATNWKLENPKRRRLKKLKSKGKSTHTQKGTRHGQKR